MIGCGNEIVHIRRESSVGELAFAAAQPGEIEAQHRDAMGHQAVCDQPGRLVVLAAGEAMREQRHRADRSIGPIEQGCEFGTLSIGEIEPLGRHDS